MASTDTNQMVVLVEHQNGDDAASEWLPEDEEIECPECNSAVTADCYFGHVTTGHRMFPCLYCFRNFETSKYLWDHLSSDHEVEVQSFRDGTEYVDNGGDETSLLCVECDKVLESDSLEASIIIHKSECESCESPLEELNPAFENEISSPTTPVTISEPRVRSPRKSVVTVENNFVTSHLRNRSNACKHCGEKFSVSTIAAHVRACTGKSTNSTSHGSNNYLREMPPLRKPSTEVFTRTAPPKLTAAVPVKNQNGNAYPHRKNGLPAPPKLQPAPTFRNRVEVEERPQQSESAISSKYESIEPSVPSYLPSPLPTEHYEASDFFDLQQSTPTAKSKSRKGFKSKKRQKSRSSKGEKASLQVSSGVTSPLVVPTKIEVPAEVPEPSPPPSPVYIDPLLREQDDDKRLSLLVSELTEKLDMLSEHCPKSYKIYEVIFHETNKSDDWILNEMVMQSSKDCTYCKLVRLIKVDKRQLVLHLISRHCWKISVIHPVRVVENPVASVTEDIDETYVKSETPDENPIPAITSTATPQHSAQLQDTDVANEDLHGDSHIPSLESTAIDSTAQSETDASTPPDNTSTEPTIASTSPKPQVEEDSSSSHPEVSPRKLVEAESELPSGKSINETGDTDTVTVGSDTAVERFDDTTASEANGWTESNDNEILGSTTLKTDANDDLLDSPKHEMMDTFVGERPEAKAVNWTAFRFELLEKVFRSDRIVFAYSDFGDFGDRSCDCLICGQASSTQNKLFNHWKKAHSGVAMRCLLCKGKFLFAGALFCHLCVGTPKPLTLSLSDDENEEGVGDHTVGLRYECGICEIGTLPGFFNLMVHFRRDHNKCELCLESTLDQKDLEHHLKKHKLNHFCWKCNVAYYDKQSFMQHLIWKHGTESVNCSKCLQKKWPHVYHFCTPPAHFTCEVCGLNFTKAMSLRVHSRIHTGENMKRCPKSSCGERFVSKKMVQRHVESVHTKPQPEPVPEPELPVSENVMDEVPNATEVESSVQAESAMDPEQVEDTPADNSVLPEDAGSNEGSKDVVDQKIISSSEQDTEIQELHEKLDTSNGWSAETFDNENIIAGVPTEECEVQDMPSSVKISSPDKDDSNVDTETATATSVTEEVVADDSKTRPETGPKPFNIAEIQGPNLSEDESDSDSDDENVKVSPAPAMPPLEEASTMEVDQDHSLDFSENISSAPDELPKDVPNDSENLFENLPAEITVSAQSDIKLSDNEDEAMDVDSTASTSETSRITGNGEMSFQDLSNGITDDFGLKSSIFASRENTHDDFGSYSPLLHSLEDFSVPDIPTFEENRLPDHIVQENALFSIQNEHDYSLLSTNVFGIKRKPLSTSYTTGSYFNSPVQSRSPSPSRHSRPKAKKVSKSPKKRVRRQSSSSSSSSDSSCSSCGPDCSCSGSSSGSSSSSSSSSESEDDKRLTPVRKRRHSKQFSPYSSPRGLKPEVKNEPPTPVEEPVKKKRGRKKKVVPEVVVEPVIEKEPEPVVNESELETDDSGSEEVYEKLQLTEVMTSRPPCDEVWEIQSEKYLLRLVRGVNTLEQLRPPTPVPEEVHETKLMYELKGSSQSKLKVRNIPIKPLVFKRSSLPGLASNGHSEMSPSFMYNNVSELGPPHSKEKRKSSSKKPKQNGKLKKSKKSKSIHEGSPYMSYNRMSLPVFNLNGSHFSPEKSSKKKKKKKRKKEAPEYDSVSFINPETYIDNELYCVCQAPPNSVYDAEMIGCDSKDCRFKWFHFQCVGVSVAPKGKWYCPECKERRRGKAAARIKMNGEDF